MVLDLTEQESESGSGSPPWRSSRPGGFPRRDAHEVRRITDPEAIGDVISVNARVWNEDNSWLNRKLAHDLGNTPDQISVYVAYVDGKPVSSAWMYFTPHSQFASLWGGSTLPEFRKRGLYSALLEARIVEARQRGIRFLTIDAMSMSRPIVAKFGFQILTHATGCVWKVVTAPDQRTGARP
jgi:GNAT superfamily N-acetyltransferase